MVAKNNSLALPTPSFLPDADWAGEWVARQAARNKPDDPGIWDERAHTYGLQHAQSPYVRAFLERLNLCPGDTVLDVGSGPGSCALPLAAQGISVTAVDFSEGMLNELCRRAALWGVSERIVCIQASWEDDWEAKQIPQVDVAFASRSIMVADLKRALIKLTSRARRLASASLIACPSPRYDAKIYEALGVSPVRTPDYIYAVNILYQLGYYADVSLISSLRQDQWRSYDEAYAAALRGLPELNSTQQHMLRAYLQQHLMPVHDEEGNPSGWVKDYPHVTQWAQLVWKPHTE